MSNPKTGSSLVQRPGNMSVIVGELRWIWKCAGLLGLVGSALSVIGLMQYGFGFGVGPLLLLIVDRYDQFLADFLGWAKPPIEAFARFFGWHIVLYPQWKHILVLQSLFFFSGARADYATGRTSTAIARFLLGLIIAVITAITAGAIPLAQTDFWTNFGIAAIPLLTTSLNNLAVRWMRWQFTPTYEARRINLTALPPFWDFFKVALYGAIFVRIPVGFLIIAVGLKIPFIQQLASPGLALLGLLVVLFALDQVLLGARELKSLRQTGQRWSASRGIRIGLTIFFVFAIAALLVALEPGWELFRQFLKL